MCTCVCVWLRVCMCVFVSLFGSACIYTEVVCREGESELGGWGGVRESRMCLMVDLTRRLEQGSETSYMGSALSKHTNMQMLCAERNARPAMLPQHGCTPSQ